MKIISAILSAVLLFAVPACSTGNSPAMASPTQDVSHAASSVVSTASSSTISPAKSITPQPTYKEEDPLIKFLYSLDISYKNYDELAELIPNEFLLSLAYRYESSKNITPGKITSNGKFIGYGIKKSSVLAVAQQYYGDQINIAYDKLTESATPGPMINYAPRIYYIPSDGQFVMTPTGGIRLFVPYVFECNDSGDTITVLAGFIRYGGEYTDYSGPYVNENNEVIGEMPKNSDSPLTLEQAQEIRDKLPMRLYTIKKRADGTLWVKSCFMVR